MAGMTAVQRQSVAEFQAAAAAGELGIVLPALTVGLPGFQCTCVSRRCRPDCPLRGLQEPAHQALGDLAQRVTAGQLQLARGTVGAMQLLALLREALRWRQHAAADAFASFAGSAAAPQLPLAWWRDLLRTAVSGAVTEQLPALRGIVALCNRVAAGQGQPALLPAPRCRFSSMLTAAFSAVDEQPSPVTFPALAEVLATASGFTEHVRAEDVAGACAAGCLPELLQLGLPPLPAVSQRVWEVALAWAKSALCRRIHAKPVGDRASALEWALPVYMKVADAFDTLIEAGHRPRELWGVHK
ncbi:aspartyl glutamyl-tRNA amidotransferase subunit A [Chlorella sorokiniana]|uniref:Aspartyl glutamyl-tRNA amidotransferase subunit A n=1 Tax=Chlorella sorokiniana TaxID=3076 RepID=A0A2P6TEQ5_CHLSO|nr:aspartyl glutamyl-tRNA amidotransferase subunit A [Chlorella sorokiniana]|eukprot:PRW21125.1 aspartyl glutamyl-tRNA amidotransferase subunit A [Chlorella sorokiniana]